MNADADSSHRFALPGVLLLALILRLLQLSSAINSPLTYQLGPDEDYYQRFGLAVAAGAGPDSPEFTFMDPAYGYLLGTLFRLIGVNLFVVFVLQVLLDVASVYGIVLIGRLLGRERAGLYGAACYAIAATAIMFSTTLLKEVWVSSFMTWWVVCALFMLRAKSRWGWLLLGILCGAGVALRSTLALLGIIGVCLPLLSSGQSSLRARSANMALVLCGLIVALLPWSLRNERALGLASPLPNNGGIVLDQIYNPGNPQAGIWVPDFVSYSHPSEIWRGYAAEADRRAGYALQPAAVDQYWRGQSMGFIREHPAQVLSDVGRKSLAFISSTEVPSTRSDVEERMFSPLLRALPSPWSALLALGLAGLLWLAREDRRWPVIFAPIAVAFVSAVLFFAESRFRFHALSMLCLCTGIFVDQVLLRIRQPLQIAAFAALAVIVASASLALGWQDTPIAPHWDRIAWGYIHMGNLPRAREVAERELQARPSNGAVLEALAYTSAATQHYQEAASELQQAIALRPRSHVAHYNLARVYLAMGDWQRALAEARLAVDLNPSADYQALLRQLSSG